MTFVGRMWNDSSAWYSSPKWWCRDLVCILGIHRVMGNGQCGNTYCHKSPARSG